jgi:outer membrane protein
MDVIRDQAIVQLNQKNVSVLRTNLQASSDRFEIGDLTRTDVAQSEARLALAEGDLRTAESNLISSRESYIRLVGDAPVDLEQPPMLPNLPATAEEAVAIALNNNPDIDAANQLVSASRADIGAARASRLPKLSATTHRWLHQQSELDPAGQYDVGKCHEKSAQAGLSLTIPIFTGRAPLGAGSPGAVAHAARRSKIMSKSNAASSHRRAAPMPRGRRTSESSLRLSRR